MKYEQGWYYGNRVIAVFWAIWRYAHGHTTNLDAVMRHADTWENRVYIADHAYDIMAASGVFDD